MITQIKDYDSIITQRASLIVEDIKNSKSSDKFLQIKNYIMLNSALDLSNLKIFILPSQLSLDREEKRNILYSFDLKTNLIEQNNLAFEMDEKIFITDICFMRDNLVFIDDDLNLNIGGFK